MFDVGGVRRLATRARRVAARYGCDLLFAVKSFPAPEVLAAFAASGVGFDASNAAELALVREAVNSGSPEAPIVSVTGPVPGDLVELGRSGWARELMFNADAPEQLALLPRTTERPLSVGARVAVELPAERAPTSGAASTRFGVDPADHSALARIAAHPAFGGLHLHVEHDVNDAWIYGQVAALAASVAGRLGHVSHVNLGGGLDRSSGIEGLEDALCAIRAHLPSMRLLLEPGGWWLTKHGFALGCVRSVERGQGGQGLRVTLDLSAECHLRWTRPRLLLPGNDATGEDCETVTFFGPTCSEEDLIGVYEVGREAAHTELAVGRVVRFGNVSGYAAAWNLGFNGVPPARVVLQGA